MFHINYDKSLTFDDVWIVPKHSEVKSRADVDVLSQVSRTITALPIMSANMSTVTDVTMSIALAKLGGVPILHRELTIEDAIQSIGNIGEHLEEDEVFGVSVGASEDEHTRAIAYLNQPYRVDLIVVDVAHGDSDNLYRAVDNILNSKTANMWDYFPDIMVGNFATPESIYSLHKRFGTEIGAVKIGIGPGAACTTRIKTGVGVGQFSAIEEAAETANSYNYPICADGGINHAGDFCKALGAGASSVMMGKILAYAYESPGWNMSWSKVYKGSAYFDYTQQGAPDYKVSEGTTMTLTNPKPLVDIVNYLIGGLRSAMSYTGANTIQKFHDLVEFRLASAHTVIESGPRYETRSN